MISEDSLLVTVLQSVEQRDYARAKVLLTGRAKDNPHRSVYWLSGSAEDDPNNEPFFYCKETLRLNPKNYDGQRGLAMLGIIPPDENKRGSLRLRGRDRLIKHYPQKTLEKLLLVALDWILSLEVIGAIPLVVFRLLEICPTRNSPLIRPATLLPPIKPMTQQAGDKDV
jgi:hypothetical protein